MRKLLAAVAALLLAATVTAAPAAAEGTQVRIVQPYGLVYLPSYVVVERGLIQKHAKAAGLGDIKVTLTRLASGPAGSDMLLAGDAELTMGGFGPAFILWDKTRGAQKVRGMMPLSSSSVLVLTTDPRIRTIRDFRETDRIAVSAVKVTAQAIALQMAAAKEWGWENRFKLDPLLVAMSNPDGMAAILSGASEVKTHAAIIPFSVTELESGKVHQVMSSEDYLEPGSSTVVMSASARFHDGSPKLYAATAAAFEEAIAFIYANTREAAEIFVKNEPQKQPLEWTEKMIVEKKLVTFSATPRGTKKHADFMHAAGTLKNKPESWKDLFWDNMWGKDGS
ncbi:MAG: ABC transporter substrate-binding protein [Acetobacteraceae bacterium]